MAVLASDTFTGSDADMNGRTMDAGLGGSADGWAVGDGGITAGSGVATLTTTGFGSQALGFDGSQGAADCIVSAVPLNLNSSNGVIARSQGLGGGYSFYFCYVFNDSGFHYMAVRKYSSGSQSSISEGYLGSNFNLSTDILSIRCEGTTISGEKNGVTQFSGTDSDYASGYPGMILRSSGTQQTNWTFESIAPAGIFNKIYFTGQAMNRASTY